MPTQKATINFANLSVRIPRRLLRKARIAARSANARNLATYVATVLESVPDTANMTFRCALRNMEMHFDELEKMDREHHHRT